jgi:hypothetical protein
MGIGIGTALVVGSIASTAGSAGVSFAQAGKQRRLQQQAEEDAAKALAEARKKLDVNYYAGLGINKEPYELEREALVAAGAQAIQAGQESERGAAATAGRIQMAQQQGQRQIAGAMGTEMLNLDKLTAEESSRLATDQAELYLSEAEGAQLAARDAQQAATAYTTAGVKGIADAGIQTISSLVPLFPKTGVTPTGTAGTGAILNPVQTPLASAPQYGMGQIAPQAARAVMPQGNIAQADIASQFKNTPFGTPMPFGGAQGASPLNAFNNPSLGGITKEKLGLMSREELLRLLGGI